MKNFKIQEFVCHCGCEMPAEARQNIEALVVEVLDPLREAYGKPIYVNSGYRCEARNRKVGGVLRSQHMLGQAADIRPGTLIPASEPESPAHKEIPHQVRNEALMTLARLIVAQGRFDQLIIYPTFLHVSYKRSGVNRLKVLRKTATGYEVLRCLDA